MFCAYCGSNVPDDATRCPICGCPLRGDRARPATPQQVNARTNMPVTQFASPHAPQQGPSAPRPGQPVQPSQPGQGIAITFVENGQVITQISLSPNQNQRVRFGSAPDNDLVVQPPSCTVSGHHGVISMTGGWCIIRDTNSTNGLYLNGVRQTECRVAPGDVISIGVPGRGATRCVMVVSAAGQVWNVFSLVRNKDISIGRLEDNDLSLPDPTVSSHHAILTFDGVSWTITDLASTNGTKINGRYITQPTPLYSGSSISFGNAQVVYLEGCLLMSGARHGVDIDARDLVRYRKNGKVTRITTDHISLHIKRGDFVAIVGGSGCGKSTLLNELNGSEPADEGTVALDGTDLYANYKMMKSSIGYVPQQDIVYDNLRLEDMLKYAAKLRMQSDTTPAERAKRVEEVIALLELDGVRQNYIGKLSGGQKKRASIAVELLADPRLLFLDEPTSGLDPGIERKLMRSLADMAREGRTIVLVTHTTLNLHLCDQVVFLGAGGKLCYAGNPQEALPFFGVSDFVDVYPKIDENPAFWEQKFAARGGQPQATARPGEGGIGGKRSIGFMRQFLTLSARYAKLMCNDRARLLLMVLQAPLLAGLINIVAGSGVFDICEDTKFYLFALSCAAFWVGIFDSIQEICKENNILQRECDGGLSIGAYLSSKVLVLSVLCLIQTLLLVAGLIVSMGTPKSAFVSPTLELVISTYLTVLSAMCLGLLVSALFRSPDKALALAPILILPQILFSGIAFELNDITEKISYAINCRWAIEALGTTADLNSLDLLIYGEEITIPAEKGYVLEKPVIQLPDLTQEVEVDTPAGPQKQEVTIDAHEEHFKEDVRVDIPEQTKTITRDMKPPEVDEMFEHTMEHLLRSWGVLLGMSALCVVGCYLFIALGMRKG